MAFVRVEQRNARLAAAVRIDVVQGKDGPVSKGTVAAISNVRRQGADEEATSIQWTLWGKQAESAAEYLGKGSRVNVVGRVQNNNYETAPGEVFYGLTFTAEEVDYLETRAEGDTRRAKESAQASARPDANTGKANGRARKTPKASSTAANDDVPF